MAYRLGKDYRLQLPKDLQGHFPGNSAYLGYSSASGNFFIMNFSKVGDVVDFYKQVFGGDSMANQGFRQASRELGSSMAEVKVDSNLRVCFPKSLVDKANLNPGTNFDIQVKERGIILTPT